MKAVLPARVRCPFCGNAFSKEEQGCKGGCGLMGSCGLICCPRCGYSFVEESKIVRFFKKIWNQKEQKEQ